MPTGNFNNIGPYVSPYAYGSAYWCKFLSPFSTLMESWQCRTACHPNIAPWRQEKGPNRPELTLIKKSHYKPCYNLPLQRKFFRSLRYQFLTRPPFLRNNFLETLVTNEKFWRISRCNGRFPLTGFFIGVSSEGLKSLLNSKRRFACQAHFDLEVVSLLQCHQSALISFE